MSESASGSTSPVDAGSPPSGGWRQRLLARHRWVVFVLPLAVYLAAGQFEPRSDASAADGTPIARPPGAATDAGSHRYPIYYTLRLATTAAAIWLVLPGYPAPTGRAHLLAVLVGAVGVVAWVGLCRLQLEQRWLAPLGLGPLLGLGQRAGYDPLAALGDAPLGLAAFLLVRFVGLVVVVPLIEEMFLRGFLLRIMIDAEWWKVPWGQVNATAVASCAVYAALSHPAELFAAVVWFSLVTGLQARTRDIWTCVTAHAVTNLLLGLYVVAWQDWSLW